MFVYLLLLIFFVLYAHLSGVGIKRLTMPMTSEQISGSAFIWRSIHIYNEIKNTLNAMAAKCQWKIEHCKQLQCWRHRTQSRCRLHCTQTGWKSSWHMLAVHMSWFFVGVVVVVWLFKVFLFNNYWIVGLFVFTTTFRLSLNRMCVCVHTTTSSRQQQALAIGIIFTYAAYGVCSVMGCHCGCGFAVSLYTLIEQHQSICSMHVYVCACVCAYFCQRVAV